MEKVIAVEVLEGAAPEKTPCAGTPWVSICKRRAPAKHLVRLAAGSVVGACGHHVGDWRDDIDRRAQEERRVAARETALPLIARLVEKGFVETRPEDPEADPIEAALWSREMEQDWPGFAAEPDVRLRVDPDGSVRVEMTLTALARICTTAGI